MRILERGGRNSEAAALACDFAFAFAFVEDALAVASP